MKALLNNQMARSVATVMAIFIFYMISMLYFLTARYENNYSRFLHISAKALEKNPLIKNPQVKEKLIALNDTGYDGQFFYFMAYDPFLTVLENPADYKKVVDLPVFRYRRIGFAVLPHVISFGNPDLYPVAMIWMILISHIAGAIFLVKIAIAYGRDPLWALLYISVPGYAFSMMYGLPESIAGALLLGGFYFILKNKNAAAVACFAFSLLFRETGILLIGIIGAFEAHRTTSIKNGIKIWSSAVPYFFWRLYVTWQLSGDTGWSGFLLEPPNLTTPFKGVTELMIRAVQGEYVDYIRAAGIVYPLLLAGATVIALLAIRIRRTPQAVALFCYSFLALSLNFEKVWIHVGNAERQTFETFVCLPLVFLSLPTNALLLQRVFAVYFAALFLYDFLISASDLSFRALLHLAQYLY